jgi:ribosomal-protein-serine acetyltransferase
LRKYTVEKAVAKKEGVLRQAEWLYDHYVDLTINTVLRSEWNQKVAKFDTR